MSDQIIDVLTNMDDVRVLGLVRVVVMAAQTGVVAIEVGASGVRAVAKLSGAPVEPVMIDGRIVAPAGVFVAADGALVAGGAGAARGRESPDRYVPDLVRRLGGSRIRAECGVEVDPVAGLAAVLGLFTVAVEDRFAGCSVVVLMPGGWGPRRRLVVIQAARKAGLGEVRLLPTAVAVASGHTPSRPAGATGWLVVVDVGVGCAVSVLRPEGAGWVSEAELTGDVGGDRVDQLLASTLAAMAGVPADGGVVAAVGAAKEGLSNADAVMVPLPAAATSVVLSAAMVEQVTELPPVSGHPRFGVNGDD